MQFQRGLFSIVIILAVGALGYEFAQRKNESATTPVVRTYQVAPERAVELKNHLNSLFWTKDGGDGGTAQVFGNGLVLVRAPIGYQQGVQSLVDKLSTQAMEARKRVRIDYFLVLAQASKAGSEAVAPPALAPVLASIEKLDGPARFRILEHMVTTSVSGEEAAAEGAMLKTKSVTSLLNTQPQGQLQIKLELDSWFGKFKTNLDVQPGEFLVLGQNAQRTDDARTKTFGEGTIYYILRVEFEK